MTETTLDSLRPPGRARPRRAWIGGRAAATLGTGRASGVVWMATSQCVYLLTEESELLWLADQAGAMHARAVLCRLPARRPQPGDRWRLAEGCLHLAGISPIRLGVLRQRATTSGFAVDRRRVRPAAQVQAAVADLLTMLASPETAAPARHPSARGSAPGQASAGLGRLIPGLRAVAEARDWQPEPSGDPLLDRTLEAAWRLARAQREGGLTTCLELAQSLIGSGPGLTPSGDDLLLGWLFTLRALALAYPWRITYQPAASAALLSDLPARTTMLSACLLRDAGQGTAPVVLERLVEALLYGASHRRLRRTATALVGLGHSTGWDLLAGTLMAMQLLAPFRPPPRCQPRRAPAAAQGYRSS